MRSKLLLGLIVQTFELNVTNEVSVTSIEIAEPELGVSTILPVPAIIGSSNVSIILSEFADIVLLCEGLLDISAILGLIPVHCNPVPPELT